MKTRIEQLNYSDSIRLRAAEGWLELGDLASATAELEEVSPEARAHPAVLFIRYEIYAKADKWDAAAEISGGLTKLLPGEPTVWICFAYSTRRKIGGGLRDAKDILIEGESKFPNEWKFPFNLACYCSQLHQFEDAEKWLKKAIAINEEPVKKAAIDDPDLKPALGQYERNS